MLNKIVKTSQRETIISLKNKALNSNREKSNFGSWFIWSVAGIFYLYEMILRAGTGVMTRGIMDYFSINATELGVLSSLYYYAYVILQIPSGMLADKFGPRIVISASCILCAIGSFLFGSTDSLFIAQIARFLVGAGSACAFICCLKLAGEWFSPLQFVFVAGLTNMLGTIGGTFAGVPLATFVNQFGWQKATVIMSVVGVFVTILCAVIIKDRPQKALHLKPIVKSSIAKSLKFIMLDKQILLAGIVGGLMYLPISSFAELWAIPFLMKSLDVNNQWASFASSMIFIGMAVGSPIIAKIAIKKNSYLKVMKLTAILATILFSVCIFASEIGYVLSFMCLFIGGMCLGGQVLCFSMVKIKIPNEINATAMAYTNMLVMFGGLIFQPLLGYILDLNWTGELDIFGARVYSKEAFKYAVISIPLALLASRFLLNFYKENKIE